MKLYLPYILCSCIVLTGEHKLACLVQLVIVRETLNRLRRAARPNVAILLVCLLPMSPCHACLRTVTDLQIGDRGGRSPGTGRKVENYLKLLPTVTTLLARVLPN